MITQNLNQILYWLIFYRVYSCELTQFIKILKVYSLIIAFNNEYWVLDGYMRLFSSLPIVTGLRLHLAANSFCENFKSNL